MPPLSDTMWAPANFRVLPTTVVLTTGLSEDSSRGTEASRLGHKLSVATSLVDWAQTLGAHELSYCLLVDVADRQPAPLTSTPSHSWIRRSQLGISPPHRRLQRKV